MSCRGIEEKWRKLDGESERDRRDEFEVCKDLKLKGGWRWPWWKKHTERNERDESEGEQGEERVGYGGSNIEAH